MATSSNFYKFDSGILNPGQKPKLIPMDLPTSGPGVESYGERLAVKPGGLHSYSGAMTVDDQSRYENYLTTASGDLSEKLALSGLGENASRPFYSEREGSAMYVVFPLTVTRGDTLAELLTLLMSNIPTVVISKGSQGWVEPTWSATASRQLIGFIAALQGPPTSFATSSSPIDLTRTAVWIEAAQAALSRPGGVKDAYGAVVPSSIAGDKSAAKYLSNVYATLRGCTTDENVLEAIKTLEKLIKLWCRDQGDKALHLVRQQKISWSAVLRKAAPMKKKKVKGTETFVLSPPTKPSKSPWLTQAERGYLSHLTAAEWAAPDKKREEWQLLTAEQQHIQFLSFVKAVKLSYDTMNGTSQAIHAKLGHRKRWVYSCCENKDVAPRNKKDKADPFKWAAAFYKLDLTAVIERGKKVFNPAHYLENKFEADNTFTWLLGLENSKEIAWSECPYKDPNLHMLFKIWLERFSPSLEIQSSPEEPSDSLESENPFRSLIDMIM
jgi:hypothetical protein